MTDTVIVALISLAGIILSGLISVVASSTLISWRMKEVEKRLDSHNGYAQKFAESAIDIAILKQDVAYIKERLHGGD